MFEVVEFERPLGPGQTPARVGVKQRGLASMLEAAAAAQRCAEQMGQSGENKEHGYWWGRRAGAKRTAIFVPQAEFELDDLRLGA